MERLADQPLTAPDDPRRARVSELCLALPETTVRNERHLTARVRKRTFVWLLDNHHGDGRVALACKVMPGENAALAEGDSDRFYLPAYLGADGWVALRLDAGAVDWDEVNDLLHTSYGLVAPKRLAARLPCDG